MELSKFITKYFFHEEQIDLSFIKDNINKNKGNKSLKVDDIFVGKIKTTIKDNSGQKKRLNGLYGIYKVIDTYDKITLQDPTGSYYKTTCSAITIIQNKAQLESVVKELITNYEETIRTSEQVEFDTNSKDKSFKLSLLEPEEKLEKVIETGMNNIWMVGPAGCGKSTMARNVANAKKLPYLCISCGIGTSATEFVGYKYPTRESTKFAEFYAKPSIILIDEMTALDPAVAQILNAALANGEIETTTGLVRRHPKCIIIATSNTFGTGADRQYVANNQLDASTIDRFVGAVVEVTYSEKFENQYDNEVVEYINDLRKLIKEKNLRRIASTRMIQAGHCLKRSYIMDWKERLIINWSDTEHNLLEEYFERKYKLKNAA